MPDPLPDARTRPAFLFGDPVAHSLSPLLHNTAFRAAGCNLVYLAARVPADALGAAVAGLRAVGGVGANVTIPHKQAVIPHLDRLTPEAEAMGAVNTIVREEDGSLRGDNTDAAGFLYGLGAALHGVEILRDADALIFGSGGAARAVAWALLREVEPATLTFAARTPARAEALAETLAPFDPRGALRVVPMDEARPSVRASRLVVNATPVGMHPHEDATPWPAADLGPEHTVYDLVYNPVETRFLREAAARGATVIGGLDMLVGQAAASFEQWTGRPMPLAAVRTALRRRTAT